MNESPSLLGRLRAALAATLAAFAAGARRLENSTSRGVRPILVGFVVLAVVAAGLFAVVHESRHAFGWMHRGPEIGRGPGGPAPKPEGKPHGEPFGQPDGRADGRPVGKPELPPPPAGQPAPAGPPRAVAP